MYSEFEQKLVAKATSAAPSLYPDQREQFVRTIPWLALVNVILAIVLGGWLGGAISLVGMLVSPSSGVGVIFPFFFLLGLVSPILWALSFQPLRGRRRLGWRLFVLGTFLSFLGALLSLSLFGILFGGAILYFTILCYDEFYRS